MDIDLWFNTFELLIVFIVGLALFDFISSEAAGSAFEKNYLARDHSLLINTIYASPGDLVYKYPEKAEKYVFDFRQGKVGVSQDNEFAETGVISYPFSHDKSYAFSYEKLGPNANITYIKTKDGIKVASFKALPLREGNMGGAGASGGFQ